MQELLHKLDEIVLMKLNLQIAPHIIMTMEIDKNIVIEIIKVDNI